jgi:hypothetical protein
MPAIKRMPVPYNNRASKAVTPSIWANTPATSSLVSSVASMVKKNLHFGRTHLVVMFHSPSTPMPAYEKPNPIQVNLLSAQAVVQMPNHEPGPASG